MIADRINHEVRTTFNAVSTGRKIKSYRERNGWSQTKLAYVIGKTESSIRKYEDGSTEIPLSVIGDISTVLGVCPLLLLEFDEEVV